MRNANNLNQLLSRVKSIFGRKTTPTTATTPHAEPPTDLSVVSDPRLSAAFADIGSVSLSVSEASSLKPVDLR